MTAVTEKWLDDEIKLAEEGSEESEYEQLLALAMRELRESRKQLVEARKWMGHHGGCAEFHGATGDRTCGLDAFLAAGEKAIPP